MALNVVISLVELGGAAWLLRATQRSTRPVQVTATEYELIIRISRKDAFFACTRGLTTPLASVAGVGVYPADQVPRESLRLGGTGAPGLRAGLYGRSPNRDLWLVRRAKAVLVIQFQPGQRLRRVILEMHDPRATAGDLQRHTGTLSGRL